ncbi:hypothetical protein C8R43DRAFT_963836 [Mycena crocata]|nr:hypothetical protein C8R43DRAFT_963836 [Mycena crocata]
MWTCIAYTGQGRGSVGPNGFNQTQGWLVWPIIDLPHGKRLSGADVEAAADDLTRQLDVAGTGPSGPDYTNILSNNRAFGLIGNQAAVGEGLEREAMYLVFTQFVQQHNAWFQPVAGGFLAICTLYPLSSSILPGRLVDATRLGAICGLLMVFGQCPGQISPAIFQYLIHNGNFASLRAPFIGEWFPEICNTLLELLAKTPDDDLSQFAPQLLTYLDMEVSAFNGRGLTGHLALGVNLLHKSTLGNSTFDKPELRQFATSMAAPRRSLISSPPSRIVDADSLLPHLNALELPNQHVHTAALRANTGDITLTLAMLFERYFRAAYIPCPLQFAMARGAFHPIVDLDRIEEPGFRARVFAWAATGSPFIDPSEGRIHLGPIETRDQGYGNAQSREFLASNGTIVFRTCLRSARYPIDYVLQLSQRHYSPEGEPADFQEGFDFWFLQQCLLAIVLCRYNLLSMLLTLYNFCTPVLSSRMLVPHNDRKEAKRKKRGKGKEGKTPRHLLELRQAHFARDCKKPKKPKDSATLAKSANGSAAAVDWDSESAGAWAVDTDSNSESGASGQVCRSCSRFRILSKSPCPTCKLSALQTRRATRVLEGLQSAEADVGVWDWMQGHEKEYGEDNRASSLVMKKIGGCVGVEVSALKIELKSVCTQSFADRGRIILTDEVKIKENRAPIQDAKIEPKNPERNERSELVNTRERYGIRKQTEVVMGIDGVGVQASATGRGDMLVDVPNGVDGSNLQLTEVLYSPEVGYTLIFIGRLDDAGIATTFSKGMCKMYGPEGNKRGLYRVVRESESANAGEDQLTVMKLHRRMGHIAPDTASMCKPVAKVQQGEGAKEFGEQIHSDVWGIRHTTRTVLHAPRWLSMRFKQAVLKNPRERLDSLSQIAHNKTRPTGGIQRGGRRRLWCPTRTRGMALVCCGSESDGDASAATSV